MRREPDFRAPVPVICIGNFVVGGAGKTPTALAVAKIAHRLGFVPGFLASGYGGRETGPLLVDPARHGPADVGDEPLLLSAQAPTVIGRDRAAGARRLLDEGVDLIVMDDGFQNPTLAKDLSLICLDGGVGIGNGWVIPSGPLRAPLSAQMERAHAFLIIGDGESGDAVAERALADGKPVLRAALEPAEPDGWDRAPVFAFAGIGRPEKFYDSLRDAGATIEATRSFADHHTFSEAEARALLSEADQRGLRLVTTDKDQVRMRGGGGALAELSERVDAFGVSLRFDDEAALIALIEGAIEARSSAPEPR